jgi:hypothetical protein
MVNIVLTVCMAAWSAHCTDERPVVADLSIMSCMIQGQQIAAEWLSDHPKWMLQRWRCEIGVPKQVPS